MADYILVLICVVLIVAGQLLLKQGMLEIGFVTLDLQHILVSLRKAVCSPFIISGFALYLVSSFIWLVVISRKELSAIQPLTALSYVFVLFFSWLVFKEDVNPMRMLGVLAITAGVVLVVRS